MAKHNIISGIFPDNIQLHLKQIKSCYVIKNNIIILVDLFPR